MKLMLLVVDDARSTCYPIFRVVRLSKPRRAGLILSYNGPPSQHPCAIGCRIL